MVALALAPVAARGGAGFSRGALVAARGGARVSRVFRSALVVFVAPGEVTRESGAVGADAVEAELESIPALSVGILSATQGSYTTAQLLLDVTQGARVSASAYTPPTPPPLRVALAGGAPRAGGHPRRTLPHPQANRLGQVDPWGRVLARARSAPQLLDPGLLGASVPGGGAYAGWYGADAVDGALAADRYGEIAAVSLGSPSTLLARISALFDRHSLVVADLPSGLPGYADLRTLAAKRPPSELLVAVQRAPDDPDHELLWCAFAGLGAGGRTLTSQTTNQRGLIAAIDLAPTILTHLGAPVPADMRGKPVELDGGLEGAHLDALKARLEVIDSRRLPALECLAAAWALLLLAASAPLGWGDRRGRRGWALRCGALAMLWAPVAALIPAALEPTRTVEFAVLVGACFAFGALTDRLLAWPRAPIAPAVAAVVALSVDALAGTQLLMRSLLGPNPAFGARFYGIGNELKSGLAVLAFAGVAAALYPAVRGRRAALMMGMTGVVLAAIEGSARIGAGVGGVILVSAGAAVATVVLLPGALTRRRLLIVMGAPVVGLVALAALDLATAHGSGHFTGSVLDARSAGDLRDVIVRRYTAAWDELKNHLMPFATALAIFASAVAVRREERVLAPVGSDPAWRAALLGGLVSGVIGALSEDSGPVLLVVAVFALACVLGYLWGRPRVASAHHIPPRSDASAGGLCDRARPPTATPSIGYRPR
jgi:hypothetical protein